MSCTTTRKIFSRKSPNHQETQHNQVKQKIKTQPGIWMSSGTKMVTGDRVVKNKEEGSGKGTVGGVQKVEKISFGALYRWSPNAPHPQCVGLGDTYQTRLGNMEEGIEPIHVGESDGRRWDGQQKQQITCEL